MDAEKPTIDEVYLYSKPIIKSKIKKYAARHPQEIRDEIESSAYLRVCEAFHRIEGPVWKSFIYHNIEGAVLDYLKNGDGFEEQRSGIRDCATAMHTRIDCYDEDKKSIFDNICAADDKQEIFIDWDRLEKIVGLDFTFFAFAKWVRGYTLDEIGKQFGVSAVRISQWIEAFKEKLQTESFQHSQLGKQIIDCLGLTEYFDTKLDSDLMQTKARVSLDDSKVFRRKKEEASPEQISFDLP